MCVVIWVSRTHLCSRIEDYWLFWGHNLLTKTAHIHPLSRSVTAKFTFVHSLIIILRKGQGSNLHVREDTCFQDKGDANYSLPFHVTSIRFGRIFPGSEPGFLPIRRQGNVATGTGFEPVELAPSTLAKLRDKPLYQPIVLSATEESNLYDLSAAAF